MAKYIPVDDITPNMVLAEPILNNFGQTLMGAGLVLEDKHKRILKTWNIRSIAIKQSEADQEQVIPDEVKQLAKERIMHRIKWEPRNALEKNLIQMAVIYYSKKILQNK